MTILLEKDDILMKGIFLVVESIFGFRFPINHYCTSKMHVAGKIFDKTCLNSGRDTSFPICDLQSAEGQMSMK